MQAEFSAQGVRKILQRVDNSPSSGNDIVEQLFHEDFRETSGFLGQGGLGATLQIPW